MVAFIDNITFHPVPEPSTMALLTLGLAALSSIVAGSCRPDTGPIEGGTSVLHAVLMPPAK